MPEFSRRQEQKRSKRRRRVHEQRLRDRQQQAYQDAFPRWLIQPGAAPRPLVEALEDATRRMRFDGPSFNSADRDLLRAVKQGRFGSLFGELPLVGRDRQPPAVKLMYKLGLLLYALMPESVLSELLIDNDVRVVPQRDRLVAVCSTVPHRDLEIGRAYYSPHRPVLELDGIRKFVAFTGNAIRQVYDLCVPYWRTYIGHEDAFETIYNCVYHEPCRLPDGRPAFTFYQECRHGAWGRQYVANVLGSDAAGSLQAYGLRLGYCPVVIDGEFAVATDFLCPGHVGSPEHQLITVSEEAGEMSEALLQSALQNGTRYLRSTGVFSAVRWFHSHGIPQVIPVEHPLYLPDFGVMGLQEGDGIPPA